MRGCVVCNVHMVRIKIKNTYTLTDSIERIHIQIDNKTKVSTKKQKQMAKSKEIRFYVFLDLP